MRPLSARSEALEVRDPEDGGGDKGTGDDGLRSSVTCTSDPEEFGAPHAAQKRAAERRLLPQLAQKGMRIAGFYLKLLATSSGCWPRQQQNITTDGTEEQNVAWAKQANKPCVSLSYFWIDLIGFAVGLAMVHAAITGRLYTHQRGWGHKLIASLRSGALRGAMILVALMLDGSRRVSEGRQTLASSQQLVASSFSSES